MRFPLSAQTRPSEPVSRSEPWPARERSPEFPRRSGSRHADGGSSSFKRERPREGVRERPFVPRRRHGHRRQPWRFRGSSFARKQRATKQARRSRLLRLDQLVRGVVSRRRGRPSILEPATGPGDYGNVGRRMTGCRAPPCLRPGNAAAFPPAIMPQLAEARRETDLSQRVGYVYRIDPCATRPARKDGRAGTFIAYAWPPAAATVARAPCFAGRFGGPHVSPSDNRGSGATLRRSQRGYAESRRAPPARWCRRTAAGECR